MKNKFFGLGLLVALFLFVPLVMAAITVETPLADTDHTGTVDIYVKYENASADMTDALAVNTTCYYNASGTWATVGTLSSFATNATGLTATIDIDALTDSVGLGFNCSVGNDTLTTWSNTISGLTFDSTDPTCSIEGDHNIIPWKGVIAITWESADALLTAGTNVDINGPEDQTTVSYTDASRILDLLSQDTKYIGTWTTNMTITDSAGNTCTDSFTFKSYLPGLDEELPVAPTDDKGKGLLILVVVGAVVYFAFIRKK